MTNKQAVLQLLEENRLDPLSGQKIAELLSVSRSAVWKSIKALQKEGHKINATTNKGYQLQSESDIITEPGIRNYLDASYKKNPIFLYDTLLSTNITGKHLASEQAPHGSIVVANEQTKGRGRLGRSFFSPADTGIYMSIILHPHCSFTSISMITIATAVAVCRGIERVTSLEPSIKWVNDIYLDGRKICGILCEAISDFESGMAESVIIGIGINVHTLPSHFPKELKDIATSLSVEQISRNKIIGTIVNEVLTIAQNLSSHDFLEEYRKKSFLLGMELNYTLDNENKTGKALSINDEGNLIIELSDGSFDILKAGEVSLRSKKF